MALITTAYCWHKQTPMHDPHCPPCKIILCRGLQVHYFPSFQTLSAVKHAESSALRWSAVPWSGQQHWKRTCINWQNSVCSSALSNPVPPRLRSIEKIRKQQFSWRCTLGRIVNFSGKCIGSNLGQLISPLFPQSGQHWNGNNAIVIIKPVGSWQVSGLWRQRMLRKLRKSHKNHGNVTVDYGVIDSKTGFKNFRSAGKLLF
jgi:hypothetical protein